MVLLNVFNVPKVEKKFCPTKRNFMTGPVSCHSVLSIVLGQFSTVHNVEKGLSDGVVLGGGNK